jgi:hypothetical protein
MAVDPPEVSKSMREFTTLLRFADLQARGIIRNREQLRVLIAHHSFPSGFMLSPNTRVYDQADVEAWLDDRRRKGGGPPSPVAGAQAA